MMRSVLVILGLCGVLAGCSWTGSGAGSVTTGWTAYPPSSSKVTALVRPLLARAGRGAVSRTECAVEDHLRAKCDFDFAQGVGGGLLLSAWFQLRPHSTGWKVVPICRGIPGGMNPLCPHNKLHLGGGNGSTSVGQTVVVPSEKVNDWIGAVLPHLYRAGLRVSIPAWNTESWDSLGALIVRPAPGTVVPRGSVVILRLENALGSPGVLPGNHHYVVPNVTGETLNDAAHHIEAARLPWTVQAAALPPTATRNLFSAYCVTDQTPSAGTSQTSSSGSGPPPGVALVARPCPATA